MSRKQDFHWSDVLLMGLSLVVFVYVALRAALLDMTYDEAWTLQAFADLPLRGIFTCSPCDANNHILNTLLIKFFQSIFGTSLFTARLPNLLALVVYLLSAYKVAQRLEVFPKILLFVVLVSNPFLLDFFGLARGYGISVAFITASVHFSLSYLENSQPKSAVLAIAMAAIAVLANFTALYFFMAVGAIIALVQLQRWNQSSPKLLASELAIALALALIIITPVLKLKQNGNLYYGGSTGFYEDTFTSLTAYTYGQPFDPTTALPYLNIFLALSLLIIAVSIADRINNLQEVLKSRKAMVLALFAVPAIISILFVHFLDNLYLIDRTALFLYPLLVIAIAFWADSLHHRWARMISYTALGALSLMMILNLVPNLNLYKTTTWPHDSRTTEILDFIKDRSGHDEVVRIDASWPMERSLQYHLGNEEYQNLHFVKQQRSTVEADVDYFLFFNTSLHAVGYVAHQHPILSYSRDTVLSFPQESIWVFSNIAPPDTLQQ